MKGGGDELSLPLVDSPLPGLPQDHPELLSGERYPVAEPFSSTTRYWHRIPLGAALAKSRQEVLANDLLLIETAEGWVRRPRAILGHLCVFKVRSREDKQTQLVLGSVGKFSANMPTFFDEEIGLKSEDKYEAYAVDLYGDDLGEAALIVPGGWQSGETPLRTTPDEAWDIQKVAPNFEGRRLDRADVVGVVIQLVRRF
ncbi:MAG: hypothetical protein U0792_06930 [Gemmataceae bacterium]